MIYAPGVDAPYNIEPDQLDQLLHHWSVWRRRRDDGGLGYPKQCNYTRLMPRVLQPGSEPLPADIDHIGPTVDKFVCALPEQLKEIILTHYTWGGTVEQRIRKMHISTATYYRRLGRATEQLRNDLGEGVPGAMTAPASQVYA